MKQNNNEQIVFDMFEEVATESIVGKRLRVYTIVVFSFIRTFAPSF